MKNTRKIGIIEVILIFVTYVNIVSLVLLAAGVFSSWLALVVGLVLAVSTILLLHAEILVKDSRFDYWLFAILLLSLFLRLKPYIYLAGGQDQGLYVNMSKQIEINGGYVIKDELRQNLSPEQKEIYDTEGNWGFVPGIEWYKYNPEQSEYIMPYNPLHPFWMTIFGDIAGDYNRVYSLTFFSILSLIGVYLLAYEVSGKNKWVGRLSVFLLAINPLHTFFSKFPVTEVVALAFTSFGFYYLVKFYSEAKSKVLSSRESKDTVIVKNSSKAIQNSTQDHRVRLGWLNLALSVVMFNGYFYTRISGFTYIPVFFLFSLLTMLLEEDAKVKKQLQVYFAALLITLSASYLYYYIFMYNLFSRYFNAYFVNKLGSGYGWKLGILIFFPIVAYVLIWLFKGKKWLKSAANWIVKNRVYFSFSLLVLVLAYTLYKYYALGFTNKYIGTPYETVDHMTGRGWMTIKYMSPWSAVLYLTPLGIIWIPEAIWLFGGDNLYEKLRDRFYGRLNLGIATKTLLSLMIFTAVYFAVLIMGLEPYVRYQYYYGRYFLVEVVPLGLILISLILIRVLNRSNKVLRVIAIATIIFMTAYSLFFTQYQFRGQEGATADFLEAIDNSVDKDDLLLVFTPGLYLENEILTPIMYYKDFDVFRFENPYLPTQPVFTDIYSNYDEVYLLSMYDFYDDYNMPEGLGCGDIDAKNLSVVSYLMAMEARELDFVLVDSVMYRQSYLTSCSSGHLEEYFNVDLVFPDLPFPWCKGLIPSTFNSGFVVLYLYRVE